MVIDLTDTERLELRDLIMAEVLAMTDRMKARVSSANPIDANVDRLRWERIEFLLAIREKLTGRS